MEDFQPPSTSITKAIVLGDVFVLWVLPFSLSLPSRLRVKYGSTVRITYGCGSRDSLE